LGHPKRKEVCSAQKKRGKGGIAYREGGKDECSFKLDYRRIWEIFHREKKATAEKNEETPESMRPGEITWKFK